MINMENMNRLMMNGVESAAQMSVGQTILKMVDKVMWIIEKSVQWSLPASEAVTEENGKSFGKPELVRPLPWIVFLPTILMLRLFRASINTFAVVFGYPAVEPSDMIRVIQRGRRRLRAIKSSGLKSMRQKKTPGAKDRPMSMREASKNLAKSIRLTLSTLSCLDAGSKSSPSPPPTKIRVSNYLDYTSTPVLEGKMKDEDDILSPKGDVKRKYSELSDDSEGESEDEALITKIDRLADESVSDKDYSPDESTTSDLSDSVDSEGDISIPMSEIQELIDNSEPDQEILRERTEKAKTQDSETNKSCNKAETTKSEQVMERPQHLSVAGWENGSDEMYISGNGVSDGQTDTAYYSPISWKSISPELSPDNKNNQIELERKLEEWSNGEVNTNEKKDHVTDTDGVCVEGVEMLANGLAKEKQKLPSSHSNGQSQKHQKHKRGNHGHRKKK